ncbi:hypothetical protein [Maribacter halichondriae]|uniref:hypothetical protein n=1 Tax=Maribacter halichondriae TaxID=2980554 RepID=UPI00235845A7|nr:hypothetical protein [Maribacter sp. Hal144]
MAFMVVDAMMAQGNIHSPGEGGVFTPERYALLKSDRGELGGLGNNPNMMNLYSDMRIKFAKMGEEVRLTLDDIYGSIYLDDQFRLGTLYDNGVAYKKLHMRYDAYNDEFEIKETGTSESVHALIKHSAISCSLEGDTFIYYEYGDNKNMTKEGYLIVLYSGMAYKLYQRNMKVFKEGKQAKTSHGTSFPHRFIEETEFFVSKNGEMPKFLYPKKSEVLSFLGKDKEKTLKKFIKDKKINLMRRKDLIDLFSFSDQLE